MRVTKWLGLVAAVAAVGCSRPPDPAADTGPLTQDEWNKMDDEVKYRPETVTRLKAGGGNPKVRPK